MKLKIPKEIQLGGQTIKITVMKDLSRGGAHGMCRYDDCEIWFDDNIKPEDLKGITYYHELMHFILHTLGKDALRDDEGFVDSVGNLLWQAHKTAVY